MVLGVVAFALGLAISIMLHEAGHLVTAKRFGMKATEYFVGFGPRLWSFRRGETEYGLKAIPAGGYVKILGMAPEETVAEQDRPRAFYRQPAWQRTIVLAAGSFTHFVIAFVLLFVIASGIGLPSNVVGGVVPCVPKKPQSGCSQQRPPSPAAQSGLKSGDRIVALGGQRVEDWNELTRAISRQGPGPASLTVLRDGQRRSLRVDLGSRGGQAFLGVQSASYERRGPIGGLVYAGETFEYLMVGVGRALAAVPAMVPNLFSPERGEATPGEGSIQSIVGVGRYSGLAFAGDAPWAATAGTFSFLMVAVNLSVGVINLLPLPPLDGGHLAVLGFQRARTGLYRLVGRADPGPVDANKLMPLTALFLVLIVGFGLMLILADVFNPVQLS